MTEIHDEARKALAEITAIEGVPDGPFAWRNDDIAVQHIAACDPPTMRSIAALVSAQDAQIAQLSELCGSRLQAADDRLAEIIRQQVRIDRKDAQIAAIRDSVLPILERDKQAFFDGCTIGGDPSTMDADEAQAVAEYDMAIAVINATTEAAQAYEARIRADERERCAHLAETAYSLECCNKPYIRQDGEHECCGSPIEASCDQNQIAAAIRAMGGNADE